MPLATAHRHPPPTIISGSSHQQQRPTVDFMVRSPYEIMCSIISQLDEATMARCLDVCHIWRYKLLNCADLWDNITIDDQQNTPEMHKILHLLPAMSRHIKKLRITALPESVKQHLELIGANNFSSLRSLTFSYSDDGPFLDLTEILYTALPHIAHTLTRLDLNSRSFMHVSIGRILSTCRKLNVIKLNVLSLNYNDEEWSVFSIPGNNSNVAASLSRIDIFSRNPVPLSTFKPIFHHAPHLRHLKLECLFLDGGDILSVLGNDCPELVEIQTGYLNLPRDTPTTSSTAATATTAVSDINRKKSNGALECLVLSELRSAKPLTHRLAKSGDSLQKLALTMDPVGSHDSTLADWRPLSSIPMHKLTQLYVCNGPRTFYEHLPAILRCCPSLRWLEIQSYRVRNDRYDGLDAVMRDHLFDAIAGLSKLETLHLHGLDIRGRGFKRLLEHYHYCSAMLMTRHEQDQSVPSNILGLLGDLQVQRCDGFTGSVLRDIATIQSLHTLSIGCSASQPVQASDVTAFAHSSAENLSLLSTLELGGLPLTFEAAHRIAACKNLEKLTLEAIGGLTLGHSQLLRKRIRTVYINGY
ncbi:hypothetical protein BDB00DRAFT_829902 [Zychaea mexicana]|uniref:uncharacterized protein n=1 Tax=Zychaea mexicana TaxID=64656 RepID=UPI0022FF3FE6|nr:uncharacterized protein BDB00DRAFT_829902 [Zychaea mexicana]KAI9492038.1 hypothetical protein BDB00DRAFT_829902 [Zychaea mexicana]